MKQEKKVKKEKKPGFFKQLANEYRKNKSTFILYVVLRTLVILVAVRQFFIGNYENVFLCVVTLFLFLLPVMIEKVFKVEVPSLLEGIVMVFVFAAEILGEINSYYTRFALWDTMLHVTTGFLAAAVGLSLVVILNRKKVFGLNLSPFFIAMVSFCFSMTIGVLWEFFEFSMDALFHTDMQRDTIITTISSTLLNPDGLNVAVQINNITDTTVNGQSLGINGYLDIGLIDTIKDMFVNFIGALTFSIIGYLYTKLSGRKGTKVVEGLMITKNSEPPTE
ncbi:MAG: hypothetical protein ACI4T6_05365 [Candidatus Flemingiibacterium sp.]